MTDTTIPVTDELADELYERKGRGETYEDVIWRLLEASDGDERSRASRSEITHPEAGGGETASESGRDAPDREFDSVVERVAENWEDPPERILARKAAAQAVLDYLRAENSISKQEAEDELYPDHGVEGQNKRTWYRKNVRPVLNEVAEYDQSVRGYVLE